MISSSRFVAILDACVLYPAPIRDLLLNLADVGLFIPKWTDQIHDEWTRNLLINRPELSKNLLQKTVDAMFRAFPDANVSGYATLIKAINLPDSDDRHILAAAIRCKADVVVTANLKDFPKEYLDQFGIEAQHPDEFITNVIRLNPETAFQAFKNQVSYLRNPPLTVFQVLENFRKVGLDNTADTLIELLRKKGQ
jgi:predicted nucleic acid-binding protein